MDVQSTKARVPGGTLAFSQGERTVIGIGLKYLGLIIFDALALVLIYSLFYDDNPSMAVAFILVALIANITLLIPGLYPFKWMSPGLMLVTLLVVYPVFYTVTTSFTNYSDGNLFTKSQTIGLIEERLYVPEDARVYDWTLYQSEGGEYALWLTRHAEDGTREVVFAPQGAEITVVEDAPEEPPVDFEGYTLLDRAARTQALQAIQDLNFGAGDDTARIRSRNEAARPLRQQYVYDFSSDTITDQSTGTVYTANNEIGFFVPPGGNESNALNPGYRVGIGLDNFTRLYRDPALRGPLLQVFGWTVLFALLSVLTTFVVGLFMAIILNDASIPGRKIIRSLLIVPYAIPGIIGILVWRGMLNQNLGIITTTFRNILLDLHIADTTAQATIPWVVNQYWVKVGILLVNLWLGYPYMMLICSGALQAIPSEVYEAAAVDGARATQRFWKITLPLLLVTIGPLLIASFTFNFNNFLIIEAFNSGGPPIPNSPVTAGYSDILISYTYRQAFGSARGADYGYASAITIIIFFIVGAITLFQYRFTRRWEEVGSNV